MIKSRGIILAVLGFFVAIAALQFFFGSSDVWSSTHNWVQTSWSGGADGGTGAQHPGDQTGWNKYASATDISGTAVAGSAILEADSYTFSDDNTFTTTGVAIGGGFSSGAVSNTLVTGGGTNATVKLTGTSTAVDAFASTLAPLSSDVTAGGVSIRNGSDDHIYVLHAGNTTTLSRYTISTNTWTTLAAAPAGMLTNARMIRNGSDDHIYVLQGASTGFYRYSISGNSWSTLAVVPGTIGAGASMIRNGSDNEIYLARGNSTGFYSYSISGNSWTTLTVIPAIVNDGSNMIRNASDDTIYLLRGNSSTDFYSYSISGNSWTTLTAAPATITGVAHMIRNGSDNEIYVLRGTSTGFYSYSISGNTWTTLAVVPGSGGDRMVRNGSANEIYAIENSGASLGRMFRYSISGNAWTTLATVPSASGQGRTLLWNGEDYIYHVQGGTSRGFFRYSITGNSWAGSGVSSLAVVPATVTLGGGMIRNEDDDLIYVLRGTSTAFYSYSVSGNSWTTLAVAPATIGGGSRMIRNGTDDHIYVIGGNAGTGFYRYSISGNSWTTLTAIPAANSLSTNAQMLRDGSSNDIYVQQGGGTGFYKYSISGNSWTTLTAVPAATGNGTQMIRNGSDDLIYLTRAGNTTSFYSYSISGNSWNTLAVTAANIGSGSTMLRNGSDNEIYLVRGANSTAFYRYSISGNSWATLTSLPALTTAGARAIRNGNDNEIYAMQNGSNGDDGFYRYSISGNAWTTLSPGGWFGEGAEMIRNANDSHIYMLQGFASNNFWRYTIDSVVYNTPGTFTSAVVDTAGAASYGNATWSSTVPTGTTLTIATRTGNVAIPDGTWSSWSDELSNSAGSAITSPAARYIQYRGTFGATNTALTASLKNITVAYTAYPTSGELLSSIFNTNDATNTMSGLSWVEDSTLPTGTTATISLRTASSSGGIAAALWTDFNNATNDCSAVAGSITCSVDAIPSAMKLGNNDQYFQYKIALTTTDPGASATIASVTPSYIVNEGTLKVVTSIINDDGGIKTVSDGVIHVKQSGVEISGSPATALETPGLSYDLEAGAYTITTDAPAGYGVEFGGDCDEFGVVTVIAGQDVECTVTYNDISVTTMVGDLIVTKVVINDDGGTKTVADFRLYVDGNGRSSVISGQANIFHASNDPYTVSEEIDPNYTHTFSGDCDSQGKIFVRALEVRSCTITNNDIAQSDTPTTPDPTTPTEPLPDTPGDEVPTPEDPLPSTPSSGTASGGVTGVYSVPEVIASAPSIDADMEVESVPKKERYCVAGTLLKLPSDNNSATQQDSVVYYCSSDGTRNVFPNEDSYFTWYRDFTGIQVISEEQMAKIPLGENITFKPGSMMVKIVSDARVYAVAKGGVLRWLVNEVIAASLYGSAWNMFISDIPVEFFLNSYEIGEPIFQDDLAP